MNMVQYGREHRMYRLFKGKRILIMAMDHGIPMGEQKGLYDIESTINKVSSYVDAVILNKGTIQTLQ